MVVKGKFVPVSESKLDRHEQAVRYANKNTKSTNVLVSPILWLLRCYRLLLADWNEKKVKLWESTEFKEMYGEQKERADRTERRLREIIKNIATTRDANLQKRAFQMLKELDDDPRGSMSAARLR
jgi:hypothetical protein